MGQAIALYLIGSTDGGWFKIGITRNLPARLKQIQQGVPFSLGIFDCYCMPDWETAKNFEKRLHARYSSSRLRGEWFRYIDAVDFRVSAEGLLMGNSL